jgi:hypothetical protein
MRLQAKLQSWTWLTALSVVLAGCSSTASKAAITSEVSTAPSRAMAPAEAVTWQNVVSCDVSGNTLTKIFGEGWTGGASSTRGIGAAGDGDAEFTVPAGAGFAMMGLSFGDASVDYPDIDYAFYTYPPTGQLMVFENGEFRGQFGAYVTGDKLSVAVEAGVVNYYWNGALVFTSAKAPTFPLRVDTALYSSGAVVQDAVLGGAVVDLITPQAVTWRDVVSCSVSANTLTKTGADGWNGGAVSTRGLGGYGYAEFTVPANAGFAIMGLTPAEQYRSAGDYRYIWWAFYTYPPTGQLMVFENGLFRAQLGAYAAGDKLRLAFEAGGVNYYWNGALVRTYVNGVYLPLRVDTALYSTGAVVEDAVLGGTVVDITDPNMGWQNWIGVAAPVGGVVTKTALNGWNNGGASSTTALPSGYDGHADFVVPTDPGFAMVGLSNGDTDQDYPDIDHAFYTYPPTGQLMVFENGTFRGQFGAYAPGDGLRIAVEGGVVKYYWNSLIVYTSTAAPTFPLRIDTALYSTGAKVEVVELVSDGALVDLANESTWEEVTWQNAIGVAIDVGTVIKTASTGWNNAGASSTRGIGAASDGDLEFYLPTDPGFAMIGLSNGDTDQDYPDIDYAFYTYPPTRQLMVFENGIFRVQFGEYTEGDLVEIAVHGGVVYYYWNGELVFTSAKTPTFPLRVDTALYSTGAEVTGASLYGTLVDIAPAP